MPPIASSLPKNPLVDTNILFGFLLWRFSAETGIAIDPSALGPLRSEPLRETLRWYLHRAKPIQTSPHVIAEIHGLAKSRAHLRGPKLESFWGCAQEELLSLGLEEHLVRVIEMEREDLRLFGPTDTSILTLAGARRGVVLTEDGKLRSRCVKQEVGVLTCNEVLAHWQDETV